MSSIIVLLITFFFELNWYVFCPQRRSAKTVVTGVFRSPPPPGACLYCNCTKGSVFFRFSALYMLCSSNFIEFCYQQPTLQTVPLVNCSHKEKCIWTSTTIHPGRDRTKTTINYFSRDQIQLLHIARLLVSNTT